MYLLRLYVLNLVGGTRVYTRRRPSRHGGTWVPLESYSCRYCGYGTRVYEVYFAVAKLQTACRGGAPRTLARNLPLFFFAIGGTSQKVPTFDWDFLYYAKKSPIFARGSITTPPTTLIALARPGLQRHGLGDADAVPRAGLRGAAAWHIPA